MPKLNVRMWMLVLFFASGISGLVYQIVWTRMLVLVFGNTMLAMSTVLSAFMGGLAAGSLVVGRYIDSKPRPLVKVYAWLETGIGLSALAFPWFLAAVTPFYMAVFEAVEGNVALLNLIRFAVCFVLIGIPTFLMGGTLPVLIKRFAGEARNLGYQTGFLYGLNTAGAVIGTVACGYFLLKNLGMQRTTWVAVAINLGVALIAFLIAREDEATQRASIDASHADENGGSIGRHRYSDLTKRMVLIGIGLSGFCALAYEVFWARMLNLFLHNNIYSFTAILATFLTGIALGSLIYGKFLSRRSNQVGLFIGLQIGIGLLAYATPFVFQWLHRTLFDDFSEALTLAKTSVVMIGPTILMGIAVPMAIQICQRGPDREGTSVGNVYAINTFGAILGAFAAGFLLVPAVGLHRGVILVAGLNVIAGVLPLLSLTSGIHRLSWATGVVALLVVGYVAAPQSLFLELFQRSKPTAEILHYKEGRVANVLVYDFVKSGYKDLHLNAVEEASSRLWHVQAFKMLGLLPVMVHEDPDDALMIAFGAGMSAGACANYVSTLDCVDLNPDIDGVAKAFTRENLDVINNPRLTRIVNDGRNALLLNPRKYSLIISDATNPKMFDSWTLYSQEFYQIVKQRLKPGGVFCQWFLIPLPGDAIPVILNTFRSVFPHMSLWCVYGSSQCLMLGTPERLDIDFLDLESRLDPIFEPSGMADFGIDSAEKFLSFFLMGEDQLGRMLEGFDKVSTDDLPHAQFHIEQDQPGVEAALDLVRYQESILTYLSNLGTGREELARRLEALELISRKLNLGFLTGNQTYFREAAEFASLVGLEEDQNIKNKLNFDMEERRYFTERVDRFPEDANAHNTLGFIYWQEGEYDKAIAELTEAVAIEPEFANAHMNLARVYADLEMFDEAVEKFLQVREMNPTRAVLRMVQEELQLLHLRRKAAFEPDSADLRFELARAYYDSAEVQRALAAMRRAVDLAPEDGEKLRTLARMYDGLGLARFALEAYSELAALLPADPQVAAGINRFTTLASSRRLRQGWLNERIEPRAGEAQSEMHPPSCDLALERWSNHDFEGRIESKQLLEAAALYEDSIRMKSDDLHAYVDAAIIYEELGDRVSAMGLWQRASLQFPDFGLAKAQVDRLELLSRIDAGQLTNAKEAEAWIRVADLYQRMGELERSIVSIQRAIDKEPSNSSHWVRKADALKKTGQYVEAHEAVGEAVSLGSRDPAALELIRKLEWVLKSNKD